MTRHIKTFIVFLIFVCLFNCTTNNNFANRASKANRIDAIYIQAVIHVDGNFKAGEKYGAPHGTIKTSESISTVQSNFNGIRSHEEIVHLEILKKPYKGFNISDYSSYLEIEYSGYPLSKTADAFRYVVPYFSKADTIIEVPLALRKHSIFYKVNTSDFNKIELYQGSSSGPNMTVEYEVADQYDANEIWYVREEHTIKAYSSIPVIIRDNQ